MVANVRRALAGPLGQGIANAVGLAASEAHLAARFNKDGHKLVDHYTYAAVSRCLSVFTLLHYFTVVSEFWNAAIKNTSQLTIYVCSWLCAYCLPRLQVLHSWRWL